MLTDARNIKNARRIRRMNNRHGTSWQASAFDTFRVSKNSCGPAL
jgi:hypothetical protein